MSNTLLLTEATNDSVIYNIDEKFLYACYLVNEVFIKDLSELSKSDPFILEEGLWDKIKGAGSFAKKFATTGNIGQAKQAYSSTNVSSLQKSFEDKIGNILSNIKSVDTTNSLKLGDALGGIPIKQKTGAVQAAASKAFEFAVTKFLSGIESVANKSKLAVKNPQQTIDSLVNKIKPNLTIPQDKQGIDALKEVVKNNPKYTNVVIGVLVNLSKMVGSVPFGPIGGVATGAVIGLIARTLSGRLQGESYGQAFKKALVVTSASMAIGSLVKGVVSGLSGQGFGSGMKGYFTGTPQTATGGRQPLGYDVKDKIHQNVDQAFASSDAGMQKAADIAKRAGIPLYGDEDIKFIGKIPVSINGQDVTPLLNPQELEKVNAAKSIGQSMSGSPQDVADGGMDIGRLTSTAKDNLFNMPGSKSADSIYNILSTDKNWFENKFIPAFNQQTFNKLHLTPDNVKKYMDSYFRPWMTSNDNALGKIVKAAGGLPQSSVNAAIEQARNTSEFNTSPIKESIIIPFLSEITGNPNAGGNQIQTYKTELKDAITKHIQDLAKQLNIQGNNTKDILSKLSANPSGKDVAAKLSKLISDIGKNPGLKNSIPTKVSTSNQPTKQPSTTTAKQPAATPTTKPAASTSSPKPTATPTAATPSKQAGKPTPTTKGQQPTAKGQQPTAKKQTVKPAPTQQPSTNQPTVTKPTVQPKSVPYGQIVKVAEKFLIGVKDMLLGLRKNTDNEDLKNYINKLADIPVLGEFMANPTGQTSTSVQPKKQVTKKKPIKTKQPTLPNTTSLKKAGPQKQLVSDKMIQMYNKFFIDTANILKIKTTGKKIDRLQKDILSDTNQSITKIEREKIKDFALRIAKILENVKQLEEA